MAALPKVQFGETDVRQPAIVETSVAPELRLRCECGAMVSLSPGEGHCPACGAAVAQWNDGLALVGERVRGNSGIPAELAERILSDSLLLGWQSAAAACDAATQRVLFDRRGTFVDDILPLPAGATVLYLDAGWGHPAIALCRHYRVIAIERNWTRARFLALRKRQDGDESLLPVTGDFDLRRIAPQSFDGIVISASGVRILRRDREDNRSAEETLLSLFQSLRRLLAPGGMIAAALPNRQARLGGLCRAPWFTDRRFRLLSRNSGGCSHGQYRRVFERARLTVNCTYVSGCGQDAAELVPLERRALAYYLSLEREWPEPPLARALERTKRALLRQRLFWHLAAPQFIFLLQHRTSDADAAVAV